MNNGTINSGIATPGAAPPVADGPPQPQYELLVRVIFVVGMIFCLTPYANPPIALAIGATLAITIRNPFLVFMRSTSKYLLQACVVMLGFTMDLPVVLRAGRSGLAFAAISIATTLALGYLMGRMLRVTRMASGLISVGTAICGGSAIAAVGAAVNAAEGDMAVAMGTIFLLNGVALYLFPPLGHMLHMSQQQFGTWAGVAIHDVSSVVAASQRYGTDALQIATAVKLARALWIVPMVLAVAFGYRRREKRIALEQAAGSSTRSIPASVKWPYFIGFFLLASIARTFIPGVEKVSPQLTRIASVGMTLTLFLIGAGLSRQALRKVGPRSLLQGILLWAFISGLSLAAVMKFS